MLYAIDVDPKRDVILVRWPDKIPDLERAFQKFGGIWEDFNCYRFPSDLSFIQVLKEIKNRKGRVKATPLAKEAVKNIKEAHQRAVELTHADSDASLSQLLLEDAPDTAKALRPYQRAAVAFMSPLPGVLLADSPGSGKTLQTIATLISAGVEGDILVLSPSIATQVVWPAEIQRWSPDDEVLRVVGTRQKREAALANLKRKSAAKRRWVLCNIEMAKAQYLESKREYDYTYPELFFIDYFAQRKNKRLWSAIVVDESHKALITKSSQSYKQTQTRMGLGKLEVAPNGRRIAISGTPFRGKLENLWGTLNWLYPKKYRSFWKWVDLWFNKDVNHFGGTEIKEVQADKKALFFEAMKPFFLRRTKAEIAPDLPPKVYAGTVPEGVEYEPGQEAGVVGHWLEMGPKQRGAYVQMQEEAYARLENGSLTANSKLAELTRLKQFASTFGRIEMEEDIDGYEVPVFYPAFPSNKFDWLLEFIDELGIMPGKPDESPEALKVVVASQFTSIINLFDERLRKKKYKTLKITGQVSAKERERAVAEFQRDGGAQIMLLNTKAGGVALTLDRADDLVILDETFIPDDQEQVEDRIHRVSRNHSVTIHYVRTLGTVEEKIARLTFDRDMIQKEIMDGERGIEFTRKLIR